MITLEQALQLAVVLGRTSLQPDPQPGGLVVEVSSWQGRLDPDAIGWLVGHGQARYSDNVFSPQREVWDVTPLTWMAVGGEWHSVSADGLEMCDPPEEKPYQRWENAEFRGVPDIWVKKLGLEPPEGWRSDFELPAA